MSFNKKTKYENVYEWDKSGQGTCFYCKEDKQINKAFIGDKGICNDCAAEFTIGQIGADRHAIEVLSPEFKNHQEAVKWLTEHGANLVFKYESDGTYFYDCINDEKIYNDMKRKIKKDGFAGIESEKQLYCSNSVEISEDGYIHIIY